MTTKERILERLLSDRQAFYEAANIARQYPSLIAYRREYESVMTSIGRSIEIVTEEFAKEVEESTPIYIIEFRPKGGKWQIFDMDGDRSRERAESYIPSNQTAYPDCEFRVVKYQRVEGE